MKDQLIKTDYLVIGSGVAGLTFAVKMAESHADRTICIVTKASEDESNTKYAQGGVAIVTENNRDSFDKHIEDTLIAGGDLCDREVVEQVISEGPQRLAELRNWGARFDIDEKGLLDLAKEGGHSESRIVHSKDFTGLEIESALLKRVHQLTNITVLHHHFAIDLITNHQVKCANLVENRCYGAYIFDQQTKETFAVKANHTILASGGIGVVYGHTTNPSVATGDGIGMAYRAKARISDMEFVQFHPTALYDSRGGRAFLISEAVRGYGALLRNKEGERFMTTFNPRAELAPRDIVCQGIYNELNKSHESCVYLDCTHLNIEKFKTHFPNIYAKCESLGIDISKNWIPVVPAAHYLCGGIEVDRNGKTSVPGLYACGECSRTGLHGANRLASNSLLEALVYAHNIWEYLSVNHESAVKITIPEWRETGVFNFPSPFIKQYLFRLQELMRRNAGIVRSNQGLQEAADELDLIYHEISRFYFESELNTALCELRNMVNVAHLIISRSIARTNNTGGFLKIDFPLNSNTQVSDHPKEISI